MTQQVKSTSTETAKRQAAPAPSVQTTNKASNAAAKSLTAPAPQQQKLNPNKITSAPKVTPFTLEAVREKLISHVLKNGVEEGVSYTRGPWDRVRTLFKSPSDQLHNGEMARLIKDHEFVVNIGAGGSIQYDIDTLDKIVMTQPNKTEAKVLKSFLETESKPKRDVYCLDAKELAAILSTEKNKNLPCVAAINVFDSIDSSEKLREILGGLAKMQVKGNEICVVSDTNPCFAPTINRIQQKLMKTEGALADFLYPYSQNGKFIILKLPRKNVRNYDKSHGKHLYPKLLKINEDPSLMSQALEAAEKGKKSGTNDPLYTEVREFISSQKNPFEGLDFHEYYLTEIGNLLTDLGYEVKVERKTKWGRIDRESFNQQSKTILGVPVNLDTVDIAIAAGGLGMVHNIGTFQLGTPELDAFKAALGDKILPDDVKTRVKDGNIDIGFGATVLKAVKN